MTMPPPPVPVFPAGYGPLPADFNTWVQDSLGFVTTGVLFRAERHASQSLASNANTTIDFDSVIEDPYGGWSGSPNFRWIAPYTGWYEVTLTVVISTLSCVLGAIVTTPETIQKLGAAPVNVALPGGMTAQQVVPLVGGSDWVEGGAFVSTAATTNTVNGRYCTIEISFVSQ